MSYHLIEYLGSLAIRTLNLTHGYYGGVRVVPCVCVKYSVLMFSSSHRLPKTRQPDRYVLRYIFSTCNLNNVYKTRQGTEFSPFMLEPPHPIPTGKSIDNLLERNINDGLAREEEGVGDTEGLRLDYEDGLQFTSQSRKMSISSLSDCLSDMSLDPETPPCPTSSPPPSSPPSLHTPLGPDFSVSRSASLLPPPVSSHMSKSTSSLTRSIEDERRRKKSHQRQHAKKQTRACAAKKLTGPPLELRIHPATAAIIHAAPVIKTRFDAHTLPATHGAFTGIRQPVVRKKVFTLTEILAKGFDLHQWDGQYVPVITHIHALLN